MAGAGLLLLAARGALAAPVKVVSFTDASVKAAATLRIPATGTFNIDAVAGAYLVAAISLSDSDHIVSGARWVTSAPKTSQPLTRQSIREAGAPGLACRAELWALAIPQSGLGFVQVTTSAKATSLPNPTIAGSIFLFANVAATSLGGSCCANASNDGSGTSTINKTMVDTSRGDALVNGVCTAWAGATPGTPMPDPANDPEMVPRTFITSLSPNLQHFTGTSPGADVAPPAVSYRHLRWLQTGSRTWGIVGLELFGTSDAPDGGAALPPDAGPPLPPDASMVSGPGAGSPNLAADAAPVLSSDGAADPDSAASPDVTAVAHDEGDAAVSPRLAPDAAPSRDPAAPDPDGSAPVQRQVDLSVGCACRTGPRTAGAPGWAGLVIPVILAVWLGLRRRTRG